MLPALESDGGETSVDGVDRTVQKYLEEESKWQVRLSAENCLHPWRYSELVRARPGGICSDFEFSAVVSRRL